MTNPATPIIKGAQLPVGATPTLVHHKDDKKAAVKAAAQKSTKKQGKAKKAAKVKAPADGRTDKQKLQALLADLKKEKIQKNKKGIRAALRRIDPNWKKHLKA